MLRKSFLILIFALFPLNVIASDLNDDLEKLPFCQKQLSADGFCVLSLNDGSHFVLHKADERFRKGYRFEVNDIPELSNAVYLLSLAIGLAEYDSETLVLAFEAHLDMSHVGLLSSGGAYFKDGSQATTWTVCNGKTCNYLGFVEIPLVSISE